MATMLIRPLVYIICAAAAGISAGTALAAPTTLTGISATDGWTSVGNSRGTSPLIWARNSSTGAGPGNYDVYITNFTLNASDSFAGTGFQGSASGALVGGTWQVGDRIIGLGASSASRFDSGFFKVDFGGTGNWTAATTLDGSGGNASFSAGGNGSIISQAIQSSGLTPFAPQANGYRSGGATLNNIDFSSALRSWAVLDANSNFFFNHQQWLVNYDALTRLNVPVAAIGSTSKFSLGIFGEGGGADVAFSSRLIFPTGTGTVPEPATLALVGLALASAAVISRRRKV